MQIALLPYLDEHATVIAAETDDVWRGLAETLDRSFSASDSSRRRITPPRSTTQDPLKTRPRCIDP
jgi:hypothetical protein